MTRVIRSITRAPASRHIDCGVTRASKTAPCTLPKGHLGVFHVACDDNGDEIETWKDGASEPL